MFFVDFPVIRLLFEHFYNVLFNYGPKVFGLGLIQKLPNDFIVVSLEIAHGKSDSFLINFLELVDWVILRCGYKVKLALPDVFFRFEKSSHV